MANFPTSVTTFANRSAGQAIASAHINSVQDEINAIEDGYLNGTARLNSSNSTVTNLSVAGGSTFVGSAVFSSLVRATAQPRSLVYSSVAQALPDGVYTDIAFESEEYNVGGLHSTAANPSRLTIPSGSSGLYIVGARIHMSTGSGPAQIACRLVKNSTTEIATQDVIKGSTVGSYTIGPMAPVVLDAGDYVEVSINSVGSTGSLVAGATRRGWHEFWAVKLW